jgi:NADH-quinone oxidoreductase subunit G
MSEPREITLTIDGREIVASEGQMLHDAAREGDVEIPVFCYEPKLGEPVGACRMCLVEIEGIPKLQTSCSTPVREGMVVHTRTEQVKHAQSAVVEFLLVNHPLDCPVCDKGGECPLQDITQGWGPGKSRVIDEKRHFEKPIELSPLVAIDRERCILCYRCVRFSQEVSEDAELQLLERGDRTFVGTFDDRPYVAPFHGNITELCPVGALTNYTYRFRARPWDIEQAGSVCTLCPSQCNVSFTVRDEKVKRVLGRDNAEVDDGWLCDRGRYGFEMFADAKRVDGPRLKGGAATDWNKAIEGAAAGLRATGGATAAIVGDASNEEAYLVQRLLREALGSPHIDSRPSRGPGREALVRLAQPGLSAKVSDIDGADVILVVGTDPLHSSPILDLRIRKAIRRNGARLAVATERPTPLDGGAEAIARYAPGEGAHFVGELASAVGGAENVATPLAESLRGAGKVVVVWGERVARDGNGAEALLELAAALGTAAGEGSGLLEIPDFANARGLREAGCLPYAGPGLGATNDASVLPQGTNASLAGKPTEEIRAALESGELKGLILFGVDPLRDFPDTKAWETAITAADFVVCFAMHENATSAKADVLFPLETHAEKDGTVTHPDGRLQRVRPSAGRPGDILPNIQVLAALSEALGHDTGIDSQPTAFAALTEAVPFYASITDADIGGRGIRWQDTPSSASVPVPEEPAGAGSPDTQRDSASGDPAPAGSLALGTYRDLWAGPITELNPPLKFLTPQQRLEISPADAARLDLKSGDRVRVGQNGAGVEATVQIRERVAAGVVFLAEGVSVGNANSLLNGGPVRVEIAKLNETPA